MSVEGRQNLKTGDCMNHRDVELPQLQLLLSRCRLVARMVMTRLAFMTMCRGLMVSLERTLLAWVMLSFPEVMAWFDTSVLVVKVSIEMVV